MAPHVTSQFVRLAESPYSRLPSPQHGKSSSKVLRENNSIQNFPLSGNKKSFSALDLRSAQKISHEQGKNLWPKRNSIYSKLANSGGIENLMNGSQYRSVQVPRSTKFDGNKNTYAHGSILKKSENHSEDYEAKYDEFISSMKSKRKVLFKNKVSVIRFDSDAESGRSISECAKNQTLQYRRQGSMASKGAFIPPQKSLPPPLPPSFVVPSQRQKVIPQKLKPNSSTRNESVYLIPGDEINEKERVPSSNNVGSSTSSVLSNYSASPQPSQQHEYESILYKTPSGAFIINNSSKEQDGDSLTNSVSSSKSSSKETSGLVNSKSSKNNDKLSNNSSSSTFSNNNSNNSLRHPKKEATFGYHVTSDSNKLVISVKLGLTIHPNDVLVKANKNGTKLRIVTNPDSSSSLKLDEQIMLPIQLNPYKLSAKIDQTGNLLIEAPISK